jgi:hypothetical protein
VRPYSQPDQWVVLDRVEPGKPKPDYCTHGRATCMGCQAWCWLGDQTHDLVSSGRAGALCRQCAIRYAPANTSVLGNAGDHRRANGPHCQLT